MAYHEIQNFTLSVNTNASHRLEIATEAKMSSQVNPLAEFTLNTAQTSSVSGKIVRTYKTDLGA